ncbi:MAG: hypothetical protein EU551_00040 [Promethearchaeota archaeon]|nr:MAG: hypothetical protein EU551_00040 [Candidatus Lokiarchaeota archaeon]
MISEIKLKGESILQDIESEIIDIKTNAFEKTLKSLIPIKLLRSPYVRDYRKKIIKQKQILFAALRQIIMDPEDGRDRIIDKSFNMFFKKDPIYSLLLMYLPSFIKSNKTAKILDKLERANYRFYKLKILENLAILNYLSKKNIDFEKKTDDLLKSVFPDENVMNAYLHNYVEREKRIYSIIKQGGNWKESFSVFDAFSGFSITMIPLYRLTSNIRINLLEALDSYARDKMWKIYYKGSSCRIYTFEECQEKNFRHKILYTFKASPEEVFEKFQDPEILSKTNPEKNFKVTRLSESRMRYEIKTNLLLLSINVHWESVSEYIHDDDFIFENWHIENSNYADYLEGFSLFERTANNHCRYANVTKKFIPSEKIALLGDIVIKQLEKMTNQNTEGMMKNIAKLIMKEKKSKESNEY